MSGQFACVPGQWEASSQSNDISGWLVVCMDYSLIQSSLNLWLT